MVRTSILTSLLAVVSTALSERRFLPGGYIFEVEDGHDTGAVIQQVGSHGTTRMKLNFKHFKGVSVQLHDLKKEKDTVARLASAPSIKNVWPIEIHDLPKVADGKVLTANDWNIKDGDHSQLQKRNIMNETDVWPPHIMTQVDKLRAKGITGKGIKVAIVDTGIDYTLKALGGCFGDGCRVSFGYDLVGDDYTGANVPVPDKDPMDCAGHGTHVAGIVAAIDEDYHFTGAAPDVTLGMYRVFGCLASGASDDVLIAAFNMAFEDGADVITASIGGPVGWSETAWSVAVSRLVEHGVVCTLAAGNDGARALFDASSAADGKGVTAIGSYESDQMPVFGFSSHYSVDGGPEKLFANGPTDLYNWPVPITPLPLYVLTLDPAVEADGCDPFPESVPDLSPYVVLIRRGTCLFSVKATNAVARGAKYILFYDHDVEKRLLDPLITGSNATAAALVTAGTGRRWINLVKAGHNITVSMKYPNKKDVCVAFDERPDRGGALSGFTSWGPSWDVDAKPQVGSVGGAIFSTWVGGYNIASGTSMATPLAAAIMALILQVLENLVSATANPQLWNAASSFADKLAPVPQQGGGLIQAYDAAYATTLLDPSSLSFNDTDNLVKKLEFVITNKGSSEVTYNVTHVPALTAYTLQKGSAWPQDFPPDLVEDHASLDLSDVTVSLKPGNRKILSVSAQPPANVDSKRLAVWSGYVVINGTDGTSLSLPYQGVSGSLKSTTVLLPDQAWMSWSNESNRGLYPTPDPAPANYTFTLPPPGTATNDDLLPMIYYNLAMGSRIVRADIVPMTTCPPKNLTVDDPLGGKYKTIGQHPSFPLRWNPRGRIRGLWDGALNNGQYAPAGKYKFVFRALRLFTDESKLENWDVAETQPFRLEYRT
ncbi:hypothetical protein ACCO45_004746 [Purpureocillium lilacinum]|uniref:Uncharacterized protein n=1 Tax=Purpureocillium lilacinum TaxID=33203 RepID=A0ACC4DTG1_PURLI